MMMMMMMRNRLNLDNKLTAKQSESEGAGKWRKCSLFSELGRTLFFSDSTIGNHSLFFTYILWRPSIWSPPSSGLIWLAGNWRGVVRKWIRLGCQTPRGILTSKGFSRTRFTDFIGDSTSTTFKYHEWVKWQLLLTLVVLLISHDFISRPQHSNEDLHSKNNNIGISSRTNGSK